MSSTLLEVTRASHEEVERLERLIVKEFQTDPTSSKDRLLQSHRVRNMIEEIVSTSHKLVDIYEDKDHARKDEIAALGGQTASGTNVFSAFYDRLKEIREYHRRHPAARGVVDVTDQYEALLKEEPVIEFTGEEAHGKYLDLHELYNQFINSKFGSRIEYSAYLNVFSKPHKIDRKLKSTRQYREYIENLLEYLVYFFQRTEPLQDLDRIFSKVITEFEEQWKDGKVPGWEGGQENGPVPGLDATIDLDYYSTVEELMEVGPEKLKEALASLGLKTGGTLQQRADRLFLTKHTPLEKLDKKHFAKGSRRPELNGTAADSKENNNLKEIALMEAKIIKVCSLLSETIERTKENVEKKQALTYEEMETERQEEDLQAESESDDEDQQIYNPLKLPMGWDGKPIPYWLYKLHGLGQEAKELWKRIQERQGVNKWRPDLEEEYEDKEGNIYNKKTYTDLQRQGLI
ncbi:Splicing factor SF3a60 homolog [Linum perenne]